MSHFKSILLILIVALLSGCTKNDNVPPGTQTNNSPENNDVRHENLLTSYLSEGAKMVTDWQPNSYYARLYVESFGMVSGISKCQEMSAFIKGLKSYFNVQNATGFYVTADISSNDQVVADEVLIMSYLVDDLNNTSTTCKAESFKGYLTPYFKVNPSLDIKISYKINYINDNNIEVVKTLKERSSSIINYFAPKSVGTLINEVFSKTIDPIDSSIEKSFNIIASDTLTSHYSLNTAVGQERVDSSKLDFSPIFPDNQELSKGIGTNISLLYYKSVIGLGYEYVTYEDDPSQMLSSIYDSKRNNLDVYSVMLENKLNGVVANSLKAYKTKEHSSHIANVCKQIKSYTSRELGLTKDDSLAVRWAILTEFSNYNDHLEIRSNDCFRKNEIQELADLNRNYIFKQQPKNMDNKKQAAQKKNTDFSSPEKIGNGKEKSVYMKNLMTNFASSTISNNDNKDLYDMENLTLSIMLSEPLPLDIEKKLNPENNSQINNRLYKGEEAIEKLHNILSRVRCGSLSQSSPHVDLAFVGKLKTEQPEPKYILGGLRMIQYGESNKIKTIYLADIDLIDQFIEPHKQWPMGQIDGFCPKESEVDLIAGFTGFDRREETIK